MSNLQLAIDDSYPDYRLNDQIIDRTGRDSCYDYYKDNIIMCNRNSIEHLKYLYTLNDAEQSMKYMNELIQRANKINTLKNLFKRELEKNKQLISESHIDIKIFFQTIANYIMDIDYEKISLELTHDNSIFFNILIKRNTKSHIEVYINENINNIEDNFFSLFQNKRCIMSGYGRLENIVKELNEYA